ncbi:hypothetical protein [Olsenella kribbiana]|uniref:hypothetical protein n=1 Tax=Olsenella kribbiana TaxID=3115221 RepID=UPI002ED87A31
MSHTRGSPRPWPAVELAYIRENCGKLSVRQMAQNLGRSTSSVDRRAREARASSLLSDAVHSGVLRHLASEALDASAKR